MLWSFGKTLGPLWWQENFLSFHYWPASKPWISHGLDFLDKRQFRAYISFVFSLEAKLSDMDNCSTNYIAEIFKIFHDLRSVYRQLMLPFG